jgi:hypothetical protein
MRAEADNPGKVRVCANLDEEKLLALGELMRPMLWNRHRKGLAPDQ